jgi:transposase-like protein
MKAMAERQMDQDRELLRRWVETWMRQRGRLDSDYIEMHLSPLAELKGERAIMAKLAELRRAVS